MDSATIHRGIQKMDLHNYVDKEITFVRSNDIMGMLEENIHN